MLIWHTGLLATPTRLQVSAPAGGLLRYSNWLRQPWQLGSAEWLTFRGSDKERYEGLGFHDLRRANATGLVAARST